MSSHNKVEWSEGMFLRPQHFQQQDRFFEQAVRRAALSMRAFAWGVETLQIDEDLLEKGRFAVPRCRGLLPDGTPFAVPEEQDAPPPLAVDSNVTNSIVFLAAPIEHDALAAAELSGPSGSPPRFDPRDIEVYDTAVGSLGSKAEIRVGRLKLSLLLQGGPIAGYHCIPIARIREVGQGNRLLLDAEFIPTCIDHRCSAELTGFLRFIDGRMSQRIQDIAEFVSTSGRTSVAEIADFMFLQVLNRLSPLVSHLAEGTGLHPEELFRFLLSVAGELSTFTTDAKRPEIFPAYRHDLLIESFRPLEESIRRSLDWRPERKAIAIPFEELKYGIHRAIVRDHALLDGAAFIVEVRADVDPEQLVRTFRGQSKLGPQENIRDLVMQQLPGIPIRLRPNVPRQIPVHTGATYFEIDKGHELWQAVAKTGVLALFAPGKLPNLAMTLWAIKA